MNGEVQSSVAADDGSTITYSVSKEGYVTQSGSYTLNGEDYTLQVTLEQETLATLDLTDLSNIYLDQNGDAFSDVSLETQLMATLGDDSIAVSIYDYNITIIGGETYIKITAGAHDVYDTDGNQLVVADGIVYKVVSGVPESTNTSVVAYTYPSGTLSATITNGGTVTATQAGLTVTLYGLNHGDVQTISSADLDAGTASVSLTIDSYRAEANLEDTVAYSIDSFSMSPEYPVITDSQTTSVTISFTVSATADPDDNE